MILLKIDKTLEAKPAFPVTTERRNTANGLCGNYIHFNKSELLFFLRITQSEHMWNIATSLHCLINPDRQKSAGGRKLSILVFLLVKIWKFYSF